MAACSHVPGGSGRRSGPGCRCFYQGRACRFRCVCSDSSLSVWSERTLAPWFLVPSGGGRPTADGSREYLPDYCWYLCAVRSAGSSTRPRSNTAADRLVRSRCRSRFASVLDSSSSMVDDQSLCTGRVDCSLLSARSDRWRRSACRHFDHHRWRPVHDWRCCICHQAPQSVAGVVWIPRSVSRIHDRCVHCPLHRSVDRRPRLGHASLPPRLPIGTDACGLLARSMLSRSDVSWGQ